MPTARLRTTDSLRTLGGLLLTFVIVIALLESGGLLTWATRLEIGPWRSVALPVATAVDAGLQPLGIARLRESALAGLDRLQGKTPPPAPPVVTEAAEATETARTTTGTQSLPNNAPPSAVQMATARMAPAAPATTTTPEPAPAIDAAALAGLALPRDSKLPALRPPSPDKPRVVALVGDSMMVVGLSATLLRSMAKHEKLKPVRAFRSGTGLSRPEIFDWMAQYPLMLGDQQPEVILVTIGANDAQGFVVDGKVQAFGSDAWVKTYQSRLTAFLAMLTGQGAQVVWLSLPPMRLRKYDEHMDTLNRIAWQVVSRHPRASWLDTTAYVGDAAGQYREFMQDKNKRMIRLRANDGIHLSDQGAALITDSLLAWLDPPPAAAPQPPPETPPLSRKDSL